LPVANLLKSFIQNPAEKNINFRYLKYLAKYKKRVQFCLPGKKAPLLSSLSNYLYHTKFSAVLQDGILVISF
jgi:hypothetical protein